MLRILKANIYGIIEVAIPDTDYASVATEEMLASEAQTSVNNAQVSAGEASTRAGVADAGAIGATDAATAADLSKDAAEVSKDIASVSSALASAIVFALRFLEAFDVNFATEVAAHGVKVAYYGGLAEKYSQEATETIQKIGFRVINNQIPGIPGAAGVAGRVTVLIQANIYTNGTRVENINQSPKGDYDAITLRFLWDLFNDNVEIIWQIT
jgi:hypothetical protein